MGSRTTKIVSSAEPSANATRGTELEELQKMTAMLREMHAPDLRAGPLPSGYEEREREFSRICKACEVFWWPCPTLDAMVKFEAAARIIGDLPRTKRSFD